MWPFWVLGPESSVRRRPRFRVRGSRCGADELIDHFREPARARNHTEMARAREASMSRTVFAERFAGLVGQTPMQYLAKWRMHLADEMLQARGSSVAQVAEQVGYQTEAAFRRAFTRVRGLRPGVVRRRAQAVEADR